MSEKLREIVRMKSISDILSPWEGEDHLFLRSYVTIYLEAFLRRTWSCMVVVGSLAFLLGSYPLNENFKI